jgi:RNase P subunit RPR2
MKELMNDNITRLTRKELKDLKVLLQFTAVYCANRHTSDRAVVITEEPDLQSLPLHKYPVCEECSDFLLYAFERRLRCPLEEKPICKHCTVHCYKPGHRDKVREIMRFSGQYLIKRGRLDLLWHYFF